jgi:hypothetical protein
MAGVHHLEAIMRKPVLRCVLGVLLLLLPVGSWGETAPAPQALGNCQGDNFRLDLLSALDALPEDTPSAHREQLRDWIWTTLLSRIAARQAEPELLAGTLRQPLVRDEALAHVLEIPIGRTRATTGKDGTAYVLVDRSSRIREREDVLEALDQESLIQGQTPIKAVVYGVDFQLDRGRAEICRLGSFDRAWIESPDQGFRRAKIAKVGDLEKFLQGGVDLLSASAPKNGLLEVTGRVRARAALAPMTVEHVEALSRSGQGDDDLGFSLDPRLDLPAMLERMDELDTAFDNPAQLAALLRKWQVSPEESLEILWMARMDPEATRKSLASLHEAIAAAGPFSVKDVLMQPGRNHDPLAVGLTKQILRQSSYQCARYDGPSEGTAPAMTMFYTDLVAKLWAFDWQSCSPTGAIPGFVSIPGHRPSIAHCGEAEEVDGRLWFGARREGFIRDAGSALRFSPVATRLYAARSVLGSEKEDEPPADMMSFIRWWDRNYASVAEWEPQYELLNQIVKWTLVRRMAEASDATPLAFLKELPAMPPQRFDTWLAGQKNLRFQETVQFLDRPDEETECLNLFESAPYEWCGGIFHLEGGVDLPKTPEFVNKPTRKPDVLPSVRRIDSETQAQRVGGKLRWKVIERTNGRLHDVEASVAKGKVWGIARIESDIVQYSERGFRAQSGGTHRKDFIFDVGSARIKQESDGFEVVQIRLDDLASEAPRLGIVPGDQLRAERLAYEVSERLAGGEDLPSAVHSVVADLPVYRFRKNLVAVALKAEGDVEPTYAVLASGGGLRGPPPPPPGPEFVFGVPEPRRENSIFSILIDRHEGVQLRLLRGPEAQKFIQRASIIAPDPTVRAVRDSLKARNFEAALESARSEEAPLRALVDVAVAAAEQKRLDSLESLVELVLASDPSRAELREVEDALARLHLTLGDGEAAQRATVSSMALQLAMATRKMSLPDAQRALEGLGGTARAFYRPQSFTEERLPPATYALNALPPADKQYVSEVFDYAARVGDLPPIPPGGGGDGGGPPLFIPPDGVGPSIPLRPLQPYTSGSPYRLIPLGFDDDDEEEKERQFVWPLVVVTPCSEEDYELPDCVSSTEPGQMFPAEFARILLTAAEAESCDTNGDGEVEGEEEACVERFAKELAEELGVSVDEEEQKEESELKAHP